MSYKVFTIPPFDKQLKRLAKKYPSLIKEYGDLLQLLSTNPKTGVSLGNNCFKIRIAIASKGKGKSGGARVITNIVVQKQNVYLLSVFDKSEKENISNTELMALLKYLMK